MSDERASKPVHRNLIREAFSAGFDFATDWDDETVAAQWDQAVEAAFGIWESDPESMTPAMQVALGLRQPFARDDRCTCESTEAGVDWTTCESHRAEGQAVALTQDLCDIVARLADSIHLDDDGAHLVRRADVLLRKAGYQRP